MAGWLRRIAWDVRIMRAPSKVALGFGYLVLFLLGAIAITIGFLHGHPVLAWVTVAGVAFHLAFFAVAVWASRRRFGGWDAHPDWEGEPPGSRNDAPAE
ncbi:hypothetical protein ACFSBZ_01530 [Amnibacterium flavum]|uniref:DUF4175 domain-containing protein n=1 Tax=Amnibacterium flavum TaxID=2173173 RepID=A0A2V1HQ76_9MICO|nr:hypothetical protein [Amnibacterium flavum]PVZ94763.1 hypothetical protein DDQ50_13895 [Amnibacterium flavum]